MILTALGIPPMVRGVITYMTLAALCGGLLWGAIAYIRADERARIEAQQNEDYIEGTQDARDALDDLPGNALDGLRDIPF